MSNPAPPPPPSGAPLPPPSTPPGYAAYSTSNWAPDLRRVSGLATAIFVLLGVNLLGMVMVLATTNSTYNAALDFLRDGDESAFTSAAAAFLGGQMISGLTGIAIVVLSIIWLFRVVSNHAKLGRRLRWTPGWAIGSWFLPPALFVLPLLVLRESWQNADPRIPVGQEVHGSNKGADNPWLWAWFAVYGIGQVVVAIATAVVGDGSLSAIVGDSGMLGGDMTALAETLSDQRNVMMASSLVGALSCPAWFFVVRTLTARHKQLTGEASAR